MDEHEDGFEDLHITALAPPIVERRRFGLAYGDPEAWALVFAPAPGAPGFTQIVIQERREHPFFRRVRALLARTGTSAARYRVRPPSVEDAA